MRFFNILAVLAASLTLEACGTVPGEPPRPIGQFVWPAGSPGAYMAERGKPLRVIDDNIDAAPAIIAEAAHHPSPAARYQAERLKIAWRAREDNACPPGHAVVAGSTPTHNRGADNFGVFCWEMESGLVHPLVRSHYRGRVAPSYRFSGRVRLPTLLVVTVSGQVLELSVPHSYYRWATDPLRQPTTEVESCPYPTVPALGTPSGGHEKKLGCAFPEG